MEKTITLDEFVRMCQDAVDEHKLELSDFGFICQFYKWSTDKINTFYVCFYLKGGNNISGTSTNPYNALSEALSKLNTGELITPSATYTENQYP